MVQIRPIRVNEIRFPTRTIKIIIKDRMVKEENKETPIPRWTIQTDVIKGNGETKKR